MRGSSRSDNIHSSKKKKIIVTFYFIFRKRKKKKSPIIMIYIKELLKKTIVSLTQIDYKRQYLLSINLPIHK